MQLHLFLPQTGFTVAEVVARAQAAERAGFAGIAFMDHLVTPMAERQDLLEAMTLATWVAAHTTSLRVGHLVLCDALRQPAVLAKQVVTLDQASGGRFGVGLGWGSWPRELAGFGVTDATAAERVARLESSLRTLRDLWQGRAAGPGALRQAPTPASPPELLLGGAGPRLMALVREYADWWNLPATDLHRLDELRDLSGAARVSVQQMVAFDDEGRRPGEGLERARRHFGQLGEGLVGGAAGQVQEDLGRLAERGVERTYVWLFGRPRADTIERFGSLVVAPLSG